MTVSWLFVVYRTFTVVFFVAHADFSWANLAIEGLHILAMTLTDAVSLIGLLSIRCPTALFWPSAKFLKKW